jgi:two-component system, LytTR family, sensor kinase
MPLRKENIKWIRATLLSLAMSVIIGNIFLWASTHTFHISLKHYLLNAGYSGCLGLGLFANGIVFNFVEKKWISWIKYPIRSVVIALAFHIGYSSFVIFLCNWIYFVVLADNSWTHFLEWGWYVIGGEYIVMVIITAIIYAQSFFKEWRIQVIQGEKLKQEAIILQYQIMQNQVNPHFLFNSLNTLGSLIDLDTQKAKEFTRELSMFYRELLYFKDKDLVPLMDELNFVKKYIYLQKIRFGNNFNVQINFNEVNGFEVIPMSIQMLVENAVKHNIISKENPLNIIIGQSDGSEIFIENNLQLRENVSGSNHIGLKNLTERYKFLTNKEMKITQDNHSFRVTIPLINLKS